MEFAEVITALSRSAYRLGGSCLLGLAFAMAADVLAAEDPHAHHGAQTGQPAHQRTLAHYPTPDVMLVRHDGRQVSFVQLMADPRPVYLNFIFTTCTTVCPVMSQVFAQLQSRLGADREKVRMISISVDPDHDTPAVLARYAREFDAGSQWSFYTGNLEASIAVQRAFESYRADKMSHPVATFFRAAPGGPWTRIDGFAPAEALAQEYRAAAAAMK